jgi:hypothetical protein
MKVNHRLIIFLQNSVLIMNNLSSPSLLSDIRAIGFFVPQTFWEHLCFRWQTRGADFTVVGPASMSRKNS